MGFYINKFQMKYHRVWKVHATHIRLGRRTTMIECTDLHPATTRCQRSRQLSTPLQKILNQSYSNSSQQYRWFHHRN